MTPYQPKRLCNHPHCPDFQDKDGYCNKHAKERRDRYERTREGSHKRGYDNKWRKVRAVYLRRYPLCVVCEKEGILLMATQVDHIIPHKGDMKLFWSESNWQSLCSSCHSQKTRREG